MAPHPPTLSRRAIDIMIIIPLQEEHDALHLIFDPIEDLSDDQFIVSAYSCPRNELTIGSILQPTMGKSAAAETVQYVQSRFNVSLYIILGIAGSLSDDNNLGDVCYSGTIYDILNNASNVETEDDSSNLRLSPDVFHSNERVIRSLAFFRSHPQLNQHCSDWIAECRIWRELFIEELELDASVASAVPDTVCARVGPIVCGTVSKSAAFKNKLLDINRQLLAIETESGGVYESLKATDKRENVLVIRGISDFADGDKSHLETSTKCLARKCAAMNAVLFLSFQLRCSPFVNAICALRETHSETSLCTTATPTPTEQLEDKVQAISDEINERLNELSPQYRLKPDGYVLPVPRIRRDPLSQIDGAMDSPPAENINDVIEKTRVTWIKVDRSYPDDSLPWVVAQHLLRQELGDYFVLPIVVDGSQIRPPRGTIANYIEGQGLSSFSELHGCRVVVVLANPNLKTANTRRYLSRQIEQNASYRFILVTRDDFRVDDLASSLGSAGGRKFLVDKVSFQELAIYLEHSFQMPPQKAEVLAQRLDTIFSRFDLRAHPTYFAGIPEAMLNAFLQANRRSELIQLAVDGFLTFLVADDMAEVALSRTTRQQFLRKLAYAINVDLSSFNKIELVTLAAEVKEEMDYEIDETRFVEDFFSKGILRVEHGRVEFALPFVESYLLSLELRERGEEIQLAYFQFDPEVFDFSTFDLFCEVSVENGLVKKLESRIDDSISQLQQLYPNTEILLSDRIRPSLISDPRSLAGLKKSIEEAEAEVRKGDSKAAEKQAILDLANEGTRVAESKKDAQEEISKEVSVETADEPGGASETARGNATFNFFLACLCLGAGAERLNAVTKRAMIAKVLTLGGLIAEAWTSDKKDISAAGIKEELKSSASHRRAIEELDDEGEIAKLEKFVDLLSKVVELSVLQGPAGWVMCTMGQFGRHRVLAQSIQSVQPIQLSDGFQRVLRGVWLTEVKTESGIRALRSAIRESNPGSFLRVLLVEYLLSGVRWDHWETGVRLKLIDLAYEILRPTQVSIDKGKVKRELGMKSE